MAQLNKVLAPELETIYFMASAGVGYVSSSGVKEMPYRAAWTDWCPTWWPNALEIYRSLEA